MLDAPRLFGYDTWIALVAARDRPGQQRAEQGDILSFLHESQFLAIGSAELGDVIHIPFNGLENGVWREFIKPLVYDESIQVVEGDPASRLAGALERKRRYQVVLSAIPGLDIAQLEDPANDYEPFVLYDANAPVIRVSWVAPPFNVRGKVLDKETGLLV